MLNSKRIFLWSGVGVFSTCFIFSVGYFLFCSTDRCQILDGWLVTERSPFDTYTKMEENTTTATLCTRFLEGEYLDELNTLAEPLVCSHIPVGGTDVVDIALTSQQNLWIKDMTGTFFVPHEHSEGESASSIAISNIHGSVVLQDVTYDGYQDLVLSPHTGAYQRGYWFYPYNPQAHTFSQDALFVGTEAYVDTDERTIQTFSKGRGLGDIYTASIYHFENGRYELVWEQTQEWEDAISPKIKEIEEGHYVRITKKRINGTMVEIQRTEFLEPEGFEEYGDWK